MTDFSLKMVEEIDLPALFEKPEAVRGILDQIEDYVRAVPVDPTDDKGRSDIKSLAYKVARSKTLLDGAGKARGDQARRFLNDVNLVRREVVSRLDALRDEVRQPVTDYENRERERVDLIRSRIVALSSSDLEDTPIEQTTVSVVSERIERVDAIYADMTWDEFSEQARVEFERVKGALEKRLKRQQEYEHEIKERERLAREEAVRKQKERDEEIARLAEKKAREEELAKARKREDEIRREHERKEAARLDEENRVKAAEEAAARDYENRKRINAQVVQSLQDGGLERDAAVTAMKLIVTGQVQNVSVNYGRL